MFQKFSKLSLTGKIIAIGAGVVAAAGVAFAIKRTQCSVTAE